IGVASHHKRKRKSFILSIFFFIKQIQVEEKGQALHFKIRTRRHQRNVSALRQRDLILGGCSKRSFGVSRRRYLLSSLGLFHGTAPSGYRHHVSRRNLSRAHGVTHHFWSTL